MTCIVFQRVKNTMCTTRVIMRMVDHILDELNCAGDVSIHLIGDQRMTTLNRHYRGQDRTTDVISFAAQEGLPMMEDDNIDIDLGDIFICVPQIYRQAREQGVSGKEECIRMLVHGILHVLGYDHMTEKQAKKMFDLQEKLVLSAQKI